jgi:hypothetical protein
MGHVLMNCIDVIWDNDDKTVMRWEFHQGWMWEDVPSAAKQTHEMLATVHHEVSIIYNANRTSFPLGNALQNLRYLMERNPSYKGMTVIANANGFAMQLFQIILKVFRSREGKLIFADSLTHARNLLTDRTILISN